MTISRRRFIRVAGGGGVVLAAGAAGLSQCDPMPRSAIAAWTAESGPEPDPRRRALALAILAPNPHNLQPWLVDLTEPGSVVLHVDRQRLLPMTDPQNRQILIGHGTFLELLDMAARADGHRLEIRLFPEGAFGPEGVDDRPVAHIRFVADPAVVRDPLVAQIRHRRSNKQPYDLERPVTEAEAAALHGVGLADGVDLHLALEGQVASTLRAVAGRAVRIEMETPHTHRESIDLLRIGAAEIAARPDGIDLHGPMFWWMKRLGLMTPEKLTTPGTMAWQGGIDYAMGWVAGTGAFGWLRTADNGRPAQVAAGRAYARLNLAATAQGLAMHPVSQVLQEYPEMAALQREFLDLLGPAGEGRVQMLFRLGHARQVPPSPRRGVEAIVLEAKTG